MSHTELVIIYLSDDIKKENVYDVSDRYMCIYRVKR